MLVRLRKITSKTGTKLLLLIFASSKWINSSSYICLVPLIHVQHHVKVKYLIFHISFSYFTVVLNLYYNPFYTEKTQKEFGEIKPCTEFSATNTLCRTIQHFHVFPNDLMEELSLRVNFWEYQVCTVSRRCLLSNSNLLKEFREFIVWNKIKRDKDVWSLHFLVKKTI